MDFSRRKLPREAALNLRICPVASVKPYALMLSPVYVFMRLNEKFVSIKGPLDFFTPAELERLRTFESFYLPEFIDLALPFRQAARHVRTIITWTPRQAGADQLPPPPYEVSDAVVRILGPLWSPRFDAAGKPERLGPEHASIEPFFAAVFANELCDPLPESLLTSSRERDVRAYEGALLRAGWAVFLALHLGYCELAFLNRLRQRVFETTMSGNGVHSIGILGEVDELVAIVFGTLDDGCRAVRGDVFSSHGSRAARKMAGRLARVLALIPADEPIATIFGERGFIDVDDAANG